jgi:hypothetical protein
LPLTPIGTYFAHAKALYAVRLDGSLAMTRFRAIAFPAIGLCGVMFVGAHALATPPTSQAVMVKRQLSECMARRMGANRTLSYNEAMRTCKERAQPAKEALASIGPNESGTKGH